LNIQSLFTQQSGHEAIGTTQMKRVCAWCNKLMGNVGAAEDGDDLITHTICEECSDNLDFQLGVSLQRYLDSLKIPIALIDGMGNILKTNSEAGKMPAPPACKHGRGWQGRIYECAHARLPQRCSNTIHCSGCTIRFAVTETFNSGRGFSCVPALVNGCTSSPAQKCDYLISTSLVNGIVLLKIERT